MSSASRHAKDECASRLYGPRASYQDLSWDERRLLMAHMRAVATAAASAAASAAEEGRPGGAASLIISTAVSPTRLGRAASRGQAAATATGGGHSNAGRSTAGRSNGGRSGGGGGSPDVFRRSGGGRRSYNPHRTAATLSAARAASHPYGLHVRGGGDDAAPVPHHIRSRVHSRNVAQGQAAALQAQAPSPPAAAASPLCNGPRARAGSSGRRQARPAVQPGSTHGRGGGGGGGGGGENPTHTAVMTETLECDDDICIEGAPETGPRFATSADVGGSGVRNTISELSPAEPAVVAEPVGASAEEDEEYGDEYGELAAEGNAAALAAEMRAALAVGSAEGGEGWGGGGAAARAGVGGGGPHEGADAVGVLGGGGTHRHRTHRGHRAGRRHRHGGGVPPHEAGGEGTQGATLGAD
ncbi:hypothetical protein GPECTOR_2g1066 [Gonium pectorale]|uniref:Uncharacterized protein n=1 Tax=Gonium pectorale TaxID=33097 RepID=A0A150H027_GONPE|nr:hypothetical protein GPECTOR_2g1066 [Gonium pectorale]|eukprot:KXZ55517.1 hypothetical protein GPECTOR_2g1066 [Gonium pectorale]